jgi:hypothetical protein
MRAVVQSGTGTTTDGARSARATADDDRRFPFRPARQDPLLTRTIPVAAELAHYRGPSARTDAEVAGVSPVQYGRAARGRRRAGRHRALAPVSDEVVAYFTVFGLVFADAIVIVAGALGAILGDNFLLFSAIGGTAWAVHTCVPAYFVSTALADFGLASIVISGLITSVLVGVVYWVDRHRRTGDATPASATGEPS